jgi:hypothetical protein
MSTAPPKPSHAATRPSVTDCLRRPAVMGVFRRCISILENLQAGSSRTLARSRV